MQQLNVFFESQGNYSIKYFEIQNNIVESCFFEYAFSLKIKQGFKNVKRRNEKKR